MCTYLRSLLFVLHIISPSPCVSLPRFIALGVANLLSLSFRVHRARQPLSPLSPLSLGFERARDSLSLVSLSPASAPFWPAWLHSRRTHTEHTPLKEEREKERERGEGTASTTTTSSSSSKFSSLLSVQGLLLSRTLSCRGQLV